jgi:hypothetical protein
MRVVDQLEKMVRDQPVRETVSANGQLRQFNALTAAPTAISFKFRTLSSSLQLQLLRSVNSSAKSELDHNHLHSSALNNATEIVNMAPATTARFEHWSQLPAELKLNVLSHV